MPSPFRSRSQFLGIAAALFVFCQDMPYVRAQEKTPAPKLVFMITGTLPVVISAPHGGREALSGVAPRLGQGVKQFVTARDTRTDELAEAIAAKLAQTIGAQPHLIVARFERKYVDANRPRNGAYESDDGKSHYDAYHQSLAAACRQVRSQWGQGLLLDIHGEGADAEAIFRGTNNGQTVQSLTRRFGQEALNGNQSILGQLAQRGYKVFPANGPSEREQRYTGGYIVQTYGSHKSEGVDAMQLEFGTSLRQRAAIERTAADVAAAVSVFVKTFLPPNRLAVDRQNPSVP